MLTLKLIAFIKFLASTSGTSNFICKPLGTLSIIDLICDYC